MGNVQGAQIHGYWNLLQRPSGNAQKTRAEEGGGRGGKG